MRQALLAFVIGFALMSLALAHSWYPVECCGGHDCFPIDEKRVQIVQGGYLVDGRHFVPTAQVRHSKDNDYHACFWPGPDKLHCFFIPPMGS